MSSWASTTWLVPAPAKPAGGINVSMVQVSSMPEKFTRRTPRKHASRSTPHAALITPAVILRNSSRSTFGREARVGDGAVAGQGGGLDDFVVPLHGQCLCLLVHQDFEERIEILGVEARGRGRGAGPPVGVAGGIL